MCDEQVSPAQKADDDGSVQGRLEDFTFRLLADHLPILCWMARSDGYIEWYNRRWHDYCGTTPEQMEGWGWTAVHDAEMLPAVMDRWQASINTGEPFEMTFPLRGADGAFRPFLTRVRPFRSSSGKIVHWFGVNIEISQQVAAEEALRTATERVRLALAAGAIIGTWMWDLPSDRFTVDQDFAENFGIDPAYGRDGLSLDQVIETVHPEDKPGLVNAINEAIARGGAYGHQYRVRRADGRYYWIEANGRVDHDAQGVPLSFPGVLLDVENQRALIEERDHALQLLGIFAEAVPGVAYAKDLNGRILVANKGTAELVGKPVEQIVGRTDAEILNDKAEAKAIMENDRRVMRSGLTEQLEEEVSFPDGRRAIWFSTKAPLRNKEGQTIGLIGSSVDVTRRVEAEAALKAREAVLNARTKQLQGLAEAALVVARATTLDHTLNEITQAARRIIGAHQGVVSLTRGPDWSQAINAVALTDKYATWRDYAVTPDGSGIYAWLCEENRPVRMTQAELEAHPRWRGFGSHSGQHPPMRGWLAAPLVGRDGSNLGLIQLSDKEDGSEFDDADEAMLVQLAQLASAAVEQAQAEQALRELNDSLEMRVAEAIAERDKVEEALRQSQKMEAIGQLTGGIAHDFNNMLAVVIGSLDLLGRRVGADDNRAKRYIDAAADGARRAALLTQRLLAFSRQQPLQPEPVDANKLVVGMSDLLQHSLGGNVRLETVLAGGLWRTHVDPNQLENVILNLAVNARDAMPEGGRLTIETQNAHLDERYVAAHLGVQAGHYVMIAVSDTGSGMPADVIAKAFDPFFTTKEVGKGTGLGLSQVYGFVKQSSGHVKIYSEPGQGTTVKVYLPRLVGSANELSDEANTGDIALGESQEVILVVEDEDAVRQFTVEALQVLGYGVLEADGASAALRILYAHPEVALLFTDIVMPDVNGRELADEALRRRPGLKVLYTTGYTRNAVVHNGVLDPGVQLIGKPFTLEQLASKIRDVLDES